MDVTLLRLVIYFLFSIVAGLGLGVIYEPIRIFHMCGYNKNIHYFATDIFYMIFCGFITYFYCLATLEGKVRMFVIVGEMTGFLLYFKLIAPITGKIFAPIIKICKKILIKLLKKCRSLMYNIEKKFSCLFSFLKRVCKGAGNRVNNRVKNDGRKENQKRRFKKRKNTRSKNQKEKTQ